MKINILIQIFIDVDDFFYLYQHEIQKCRLSSQSKSTRNRASKLSESEMMTIMIAFHLSHHTNFKAFYKQYVCVHWRDLFPNLVSYESFNQTQSRIMVPMMFFPQTNALGASRGVNFIDSTPLRVCHIKRNNNPNFQAYYIQREEHNGLALWIQASYHY